MIIYVHDPKVSERIRILRQIHGYSREKFREITGMSEKLYYDIETDGEMEFPYEVLKEICRIFSRRMEELLHPEPYPLKTCLPPVSVNVAKNHQYRRGGS